MTTPEDYPPSNVPPPPPGGGPGYPQPGYPQPGYPQPGYPQPGYPQPAGPAPDAFAGFWIRFLGMFIDGVLLAAVTGIIEAATGGGWLLSIILDGAYFTYFHATAAGQTVGNRVVGIRVVDAQSGSHLDYVRAFIRWLTSYVSLFALAIGFLWMLWDPEKQTWHDKVANSYVVKSTHYPPPAPFGKPAR